MRIGQRRRPIAVCAAVLALGATAIGGLKLLRDTPYVVPVDGGGHHGSVAGEMAYVHRWWLRENVAVYGDFGGTDCVNFASQALHARGWAMDAQWGHSKGLFGANGYARAWVSSTALDHYLASRPQLATPLSDAQRDRVRVGDIVQFDWDSSGDRDHTAVVTRLARRSDGGVDVQIAEHSPNHEYASVDVRAAEHARTTVHFWHLH